MIIFINFRFVWIYLHEFLHSINFDHSLQFETQILIWIYNQI